MKSPVRTNNENIAYNINSSQDEHHGAIPSSYEKQLKRDRGVLPQHSNCQKSSKKDPAGEDEEDKFFEVWIRVKPFKKLNTPETSLNDRHQSQNRSGYRSKSPKITKSEIWRRENDYKALYTTEDQIWLREKLKKRIKNQRKRRPISFPSIFSDSTSNSQIFKKTLLPKIKDCFEGISFTLLTYGISGSGKTHTIFGSKFKDEGMIFHAIDHIFKLKTQQEKVAEAKFGPKGEKGPKVAPTAQKPCIKIKASFIEIYNESVYDLVTDEILSQRTKNHQTSTHQYTLAAQNNRSFTAEKKLSIIESPFTNGVIVPDLKVVDIEDPEDLKGLVSMVQCRRVVGTNLNNHYSSRSHVIIEIRVEKRVKTPSGFKEVISKIRFVDLAGSEKVNLETPEVIQEGANINKSLLALTNCINILSSRRNSASKNLKSTSTTYIPYRNSKLTRLLKDSLGGRTPVIMIVCLSPNAVYLEETINSIKYAQKAMKVKLGFNKMYLHQRYFRPGFSGLRELGTSRFTSEKKEKLKLNLELTDRILMREAYEKRIQELERECRYWRNLKDHPSPKISLKQPSVPLEAEERLNSINHQNQLSQGAGGDRDSSFKLQTIEFGSWDNNGLLGGNIEEEFCELVQALIENVEDENILKQNILELDELIRKSDEDINEVQIRISECKESEVTADLYEELKFLADRLEEYLDLKESAILEANQLKRTIDCTKLALKKMFGQRYGDQVSAGEERGRGWQRDGSTAKKGKNGKNGFKKLGAVGRLNAGFEGVRSQRELIEQLQSDLVSKDREIQALKSRLAEFEKNEGSIPGSFIGCVTDRLRSPSPRSDRRGNQRGFGGVRDDHFQPKNSKFSNSSQKKRIERLGSENVFEEGKDSLKTRSRHKNRSSPVKRIREPLKVLEGSYLSNISPRKPNKTTSYHNRPLGKAGNHKNTSKINSGAQGAVDQKRLQRNKFKEDRESGYPGGSENQQGGGYGHSNGLSSTKKTTKGMTQKDAKNSNIGHNGAHSGNINPIHNENKQSGGVGTVMITSDNKTPLSTQQMEHLSTLELELTSIKKGLESNQKNTPMDSQELEKHQISDTKKSSRIAKRQQGQSQGPSGTLHSQRKKQAIVSNNQRLELKPSKPANQKLRERRKQLSKKHQKEHQERLLNAQDKPETHMGVEEVLNVLMYQFRPETKSRPHLTPLDFCKDLKSESKTLVYSDSARDEFNNTSRLRFCSGSNIDGQKEIVVAPANQTAERTGYAGLIDVGNLPPVATTSHGLIQSGRNTDETTTNPMSIMSTSSRRYLSVEEDNHHHKEAIC